jgi:hypothetical protein
MPIIKTISNSCPFIVEYADLSGIVTSIHNDNQKAVINLVILLSDNGSNIRSQLEAFKNQMFSFTLNDKSKICINEDSNFKAPGVIL